MFVFRRDTQLARHWTPLLIVATLLAAAASYVVSAQLPKQYEASALILVTPGQSSGSVSNYNDVLAAERLTATYSQVLKTQPVVDPAASQAGINLPYEEAVKLLTVQPVRDTQLIQISARASSPAIAAAFANQVASTFIGQTQLTQSSRYSASRDNLGKQVDQLAADIADRSAQVDALRAQAPSAARDSELTRLQGELTQLQQSYTGAVRSFEDVRVADTRASDLLSVVQPGLASQDPVSPRMLQNVGLAAIAGLLVGLCAAFLLENLDDRLISPARLERFTKLQVVGSIGVMLPKDSPGTGDHLPTAKTNRADALAGYSGPREVEAFRLLHANLQFLAVERPLRTLLVTSTETGDGKTTVAANLAIVAAQAGQRVVLVDGDLRRPAQHTLFGHPNRTGLTSLVIDPRLTLQEAVFRSHVDGLDLLLSGPLPPNPSALMASTRMRARLAELAQGYDLVIVDSPPSLAVSDPAILAGNADGTILVVNSQKTRGHAAAQAADILRTAGAHILGAVLNRVAHRRGSYYYAQAYESPPLPTATDRTERLIPPKAPAGSASRPT